MRSFEGGTLFALHISSQLDNRTAITHHPQPRHPQRPALYQVALWLLAAGIMLCLGGCNFGAPEARPASAEGKHAVAATAAPEAPTLAPIAAQKQIGRAHV